MMSRASLSAVCVTLLWATEITAHHAFSPVYDQKQSITVEGVVTQFRFVNPHTMIFMDVTDESGKVAEWVVEAHGRLSLSEVGWAPESIQAGERLTVTGNPSWAGDQRMFFQRIVKADGSELVNRAVQRLNAIEEERRERARRRSEQQNGQ